MHKPNDPVTDAPAHTTRSRVGRRHAVVVAAVAAGLLAYPGTSDAAPAHTPKPAPPPAATSPATAPTISAATSAKPAPSRTTTSNDIPKPQHNGPTQATTAQAWSLTFTAYPQAVLVGRSTTLTATANQDVGPTPYWIQVYNSHGQRLAVCGSGTTCTATDTSATSTSRSYLAVVSYYAATWSNFYDPTANNDQAAQYRDAWWSPPAVDLYSSATTVPTGTALSLTARSAFDVGPTPYWIEIFDNNTGTRIALCGAGTSCTVSVTFSQPAAHRYLAFVSNSSTAYPPSGILAASVNSEPWVTWTTSSLRISLSPSQGDSTQPYSATATANADVGPTPYYIEIFSEARNPTTGIDTGSSLLAVCGYGTTCTASNIPAGTPVTAFISPYSTSMPPGTIANSATVTNAYYPIP